MRRREFLGFVGAVAAAWPDASITQKPSSMSRVGVLWHAGSAEEEDDYLGVLKQAFGDLGYVEGKNIAFEHRFPAEQADRFRSMARELAALKVDAIIAVTEIGAKEARQATGTIPIVVVIAPDPVAAGLVTSLAHPGGNVTGLSLMAIDLSGKRLALLKELLPNLSRVTLMVDPKDLSSRRLVALSPWPPPNRSGSNCGPLKLQHRSRSMTHCPRWSQRAKMHCSPWARLHDVQREGPHRRDRIQQETSNGGRGCGNGRIWASVVLYGQDFPEYFRRAAAYTDKILRGARPADLPVEQPSRFKLTVNLKAAKLFGLVVAPSLLTIADEVIE